MSSSRRLRICFLSTFHQWDDKRVFHKEAKALVEGGFDVMHIAPGTTAERFRADAVEVLTFVSRPGWRGRLEALVQLYRLARGVRADVHHCNEPDSWLVGILLKWRQRSRVVFDVHEHYSSRFDEWGVPRPLARFGGIIVRLVFRIAALWTDRIVLAKTHVRKDVPDLGARVVLVRNYGLPGETTNVDHPGGKDLQLPITAVHLGQVSRRRGWFVMVSALALMRNQPTRLQLIGAVTDGAEACREEAEKLGVGDRVEIIPWMPTADALALTRKAHMGLILFQPGVVNHTYALPHKLFDYMSVGLPIIAPAFAVEVAEIVRDADCGILVDSGDPVAVAAAMDRLASDHDFRTRLGENGRRALADRYNWGQEAATLRRVYRELAHELGVA